MQVSLTKDQRSLEGIRFFYVHPAKSAIGNLGAMMVVTGTF